MCMSARPKGSHLRDSPPEYQSFWGYQFHLSRKILLPFTLICACAWSLQLCLILCHPVDCSLPGFSVLGILQARILEWVPLPSSRGSSYPGSEPMSLMSLALARRSLPLLPPGKPSTNFCFTLTLPSLSDAYSNSSLVWIQNMRILLLFASVTPLHMQLETDLCIGEKDLSEALGWHPALLESHQMASVSLGSWPLPALKPIWDGQSELPGKWMISLASCFLEEVKEICQFLKGSCESLMESIARTGREHKKTKTQTGWEQPPEANRTFIWGEERTIFFQIPTLGFRAEWQKEHRCQNWNGVCSRAVLWLMWSWLSHSASWLSFLIYKMRAYFAGVKRQPREVSLAHYLAIN